MNRRGFLAGCAAAMLSRLFPAPKVEPVAEALTMTEVVRAQEERAFFYPALFEFIPRGSFKPESFLNASEQLRAVHERMLYFQCNPPIPDSVVGVVYTGRE